MLLFPRMPGRKRRQRCLLLAVYAEARFSRRHVRMNVMHVQKTVREAAAREQTKMQQRGVAEAAAAKPFRWMRLSGAVAVREQVAVVLPLLTLLFAPVER